MSSETETNREQADKLTAYMTETYRLMAQAEHQLAASADNTERAALRSKISDYETYLDRWQRELNELNVEPTNAPDYGPAFLFGLARKAYAQQLYSEALGLTHAVRRQDPHYPGLEAFEAQVRANGGLTAESVPVEPASSGNSSDLTRWLVIGLMSLMTIVIIVLVILLAVNATGTGTNTTSVPANASRGPSAKFAPTPTARGDIAPALPTDPPFVVATPTSNPQPTVPPNFIGSPQPPPTKK